MAGRRDGGQRPALARKALAVRQDAVGRIGRIEARVGARAVVGQAERRAADDRRAGPFRQPRGGGRMVLVRVRADDRAHPGIADRRDQRGEVVILQRAGIDHRDVAGGAHHIALRAGESESRGVRGQDAAYQRLGGVGLADGPGLGREFHAADMGRPTAAVDPPPRETISA